MPNPIHVGPSRQKKLLPDGLPPPPPPPLKHGTSPALGSKRQILRVNQACKACRKSKMRCEGSDNPPCIRCKATCKECVFEKVGEGDVEPAIETDRMRELENQMESVRSTQLQMRDTLHEILEQLRERPVEPVAHSPEEHRTRRGLEDSRAPSRMSDPDSSAMLPPLHTIISNVTFPAFSGSRPSSRASSSTLHSYPASSHLPPVRPGYYASDPSSTSSPSSLRAGSQSSSSLPARGASEHHQGFDAHGHHPVYVQESSSSRHPADFESASEGVQSAPNKKRRRNDIRSLLHEDSRNSWAPAVALEESTSDAKMPDVVVKGFLDENDARSLWQLYFSGCQFLLPVFDPRTDTFESMRSRSPLCFCCILMVAVKIRDGGNEPSHLQQALYNVATEHVKESVFKGVDRIETVQAILLIAAWSRPSGGSGWLATGHAVRLAVELGMHRSIPGLAAKRALGIMVDLEADQVLVTAARVWLAIYGFEYQICLGTGRPPMTGGQNTIQGARDVLLHHPLALPSDVRLLSYCELYVLLGKYVELMPLSENVAPSVQVLQTVKEACMSFDKWYYEWVEIMSHRDPLPEAIRAPIEGLRHFAYLTINGRLLHNLRTTTDLENSSPDLKDVSLRATLAAKTAIELCVNNPEYMDFMRYAVTHSHTSYGFTGVFLLRMSRMFPEAFDMSHIVTLLDSLLDMLSRNPAGIFVHRLKALLTSHRQSAVPPRTGTPTRSIPMYPSAPLGHNEDSDTGEADLHLDPSSHLHERSSLNTSPPQNDVSQQTTSSALWAVPDQQVAGDAPRTADFIRTQFAGDL